MALYKLNTKIIDLIDYVDEVKKEELSDYLFDGDFVYTRFDDIGEMKYNDENFYIFYFKVDDVSSKVIKDESNFNLFKNGTLNDILLEVLVKTVDLDENQDIPFHLFEGIKEKAEKILFTQKSQIALYEDEQITGRGITNLIQELGK